VEAEIRRVMFGVLGGGRGSVEFEEHEASHSVASTLHWNNTV
jgi:hypothetical protein